MVPIPVNGWHVAFGCPKKVAARWRHISRQLHEVRVAKIRIDKSINEPKYWEVSLL